MHPVDQALFNAWTEIKPRLLADPNELRARLARRRTGVCRKPPRALCAALRAADHRLDAYVCGDHHAIDHADPDTHPVLLTAGVARRLCAPVDLTTWRGQDLQTAAKKLGRSPGTLSYQVRKGLLEVDRIKGLWGRRAWVPLVWSDRGLLDPNGSNAGRPPDIAWGARWRFTGESVRDDLEQTIRREPRWRPLPNTTGRRFCGWRWICPSCDGRVRTIYYPGRHLRLTEFTCEEAEILAAVGADGDSADSLPVPHELFACGRCHGVRNYSAVDRHAWNEMIAWITGGLLYGREVQRPGDLPVERRRRKVAHAGHHPREEEVERLLIAGCSYAAVARTMGITLNTVQGHVRRLYKRRGVHGRKGLVSCQLPVQAPPCEGDRWCTAPTTDNRRWTPDPAHPPPSSSAPVRRGASPR